MILRSEKNGVIKSIENKNIADKNICEIRFDYQEGDKVKKFHVGSDRIGHVIAKGKTLEKKKKKLNEALSKICIEIEQK